MARPQRHAIDGHRCRRQLLLLDGDGELAIATPSESGLTVHSKSTVLVGRTWTAPTLSGTTLYVRNERDIVALDLGAKR